VGTADAHYLFSAQSLIYGSKRIIKTLKGLKGQSILVVGAVGKYIFFRKIVNLGDFFVKPWQPFGQILVKRSHLGQTWSNRGQILVKPRSNIGQTLVRHWLTLVKSWSDLHALVTPWSTLVSPQTDDLDLEHMSELM
jgi:hypothetical protein